MIVVTVLAYCIGAVLSILGLAVVIYVFATWKEFAKEWEDGAP